MIEAGAKIGRATLVALGKDGTLEGATVKTQRNTGWITRCDNSRIAGHPGWTVWMVVVGKSIAKFALTEDDEVKPL